MAYHCTPATQAWARHPPRWNEANEHCISYWKSGMVFWVCGEAHQCACEGMSEHRRSQCQRSAFLSTAERREQGFVSMVTPRPQGCREIPPHS